LDAKQGADLLCQFFHKAFLRALRRFR